MHKKIIGKVHINDIKQITRQYCESAIIPWAKDICENHLNELWSEKGNGSGYGYTESAVCKAFRTQFEISGSNYHFPNLESDSTCHYSGNDENYLNGSMTVKERILRRTVNMLEDISEFSQVYGKEPVFELLSSEIGDETEQKLNIALLGFGTKQFCLPRTLIDIERYKDYSDMPSRLLAGNSDSVLAGQLMSFNDKSIVSIRKENEDLSEKDKTLSKEKENIQRNNHPELEELATKIQKMEEELRAKKDALMEELYKKQSELSAKKKQLENELFLLETQIYSIRCANGEVYELQQLRSGKNADDEIPVTLFQKVKYMDDELGFLASVYNVDFSKHKVFESLLKNNQYAFETFCPTEKCIVVMRTTEHSRYSSFSREEGYNFYDKYHGTKTCIFFRNGENLYALWTDDEYINIHGDAFYQPGKKTEEQLDDVKECDTKEKRAARIFLVNILQGILDNGKVFTFPEKVNLLKPSKYIAFSYADKYVTDNRFGTLADIQKRCNETIRKGDHVILLCDLSDSKSWTKNFWTDGYHWENCERSHGESNRTQDCKLKRDTIYQINLVDNGEYFIRATKTIWKGGRWGYEKETSANFMVYPNEVLNLAYCNSICVAPLSA